MTKEENTRNKEFIEININKRFWFSILVVYIILISGIVFAVDPSIYGHDSSEINGLTWNDKVGEIIYSDVALEGGHSTSELQDVVWFNESGQQKGVILRPGSFAQCKIILSFKDGNGNFQVSYTGWLLSKIDTSYQRVYAFQIDKKDTTTTTIGYYSTGWLIYPNIIPVLGKRYAITDTITGKRYAANFFDPYNLNQNFTSLTNSTKYISLRGRYEDITSGSDANHTIVLDVTDQTCLWLSENV